MKKLFFISLTFATFCLYSCSNEYEEEMTNTQDMNNVETITEKLQLTKSKTYNNLSNDDKVKFVNSFIYDDSGKVISFILDQEKYNIPDSEYNELIRLVTKSDSIIVYDENKSLTRTIIAPPTSIDHSSNPPMIFKNARNNNVGGCDPYKGAICVIRW